MVNVVFDISMSLDGFVSGRNDSPEQPLGEGGMKLHAWTSTTTPELMQGGTTATIGAVVTGRRTYNLVNGWGGNHRLEGVPVFVVTHRAPEPEAVPKGTTPFIFVADGMTSAIRQAKAAAGDKNVYVVGGATILQQCIDEGLLDEIKLHVAPLLFSDGVQLFEGLRTAPIELEPLPVIEGHGVTHLTYRVVK